MLVGLLRESSAVAFGFGHLKRTFCAINEQNRSVAEGQTLRHRGTVRGVRDTLSGGGFQSCQSFPGVRKKAYPWVISQHRSAVRAAVYGLPLQFTSSRAKP